MTFVPCMANCDVVDSCSRIARCGKWFGTNRPALVASSSFNIWLLPNPTSVYVDIHLEDSSVDGVEVEINQVWSEKIE